MKTMEIENFFKNLEHENKQEIIEIYYEIMQFFPNINSQIKWNAPSFFYNEIDCITFRVAPKNIFQIILHRGAKIKDNKDFEFEDIYKIIDWKAKDRGVIDLKIKKHSNEIILKTLANWIKKVCH